MGPDALQKVDTWLWAVTFAPGLREARDATATVDVMRPKPLTFKAARGDAALGDITTLATDATHGIATVSMKVDQVMRMKHQMERPAPAMKPPAPKKAKGKKHVPEAN